MRKLLINTISIILLVFYLAGFCGFNLVKHHCFGCNKEEIHLVYKTDLDNPEVHNCHGHKNFSETCKEIPHFASSKSKCCNLEHIYLKNNPTTTISKISKAPLVYELNLQICNALQSHPIYTRITKEGKIFLPSLLPPKTASQESLCCYLC